MLIQQPGDDHYWPKRNNSKHKVLLCEQPGKQASGLEEEKSKVYETKLKCRPGLHGTHQQWPDVHDPFHP